MQEIRIQIKAPEVAPDCVRKLIDYLDHLESNSQERILEWKEEAMAVYILQSLCPTGDLELKECVDHFLHEFNGPYRTLSQWYGMALHVADHLEWD